MDEIYQQMGFPMEYMTPEDRAKGLEGKDDYSESDPVLEYCLNNVDTLEKPK